jgi:hypothetical protein
MDLKPLPFMMELIKQLFGRPRWKIVKTVSRMVNNDLSKLSLACLPFKIHFSSKNYKRIFKGINMTKIVESIFCFSSSITERTSIFEKKNVIVLFIFPRTLVQFRS